MLSKFTKATGSVAMLILLSSFLAFSQNDVQTIEMLPSERWWGCITDLGARMPFTENTDISFDLSRQDYNNQTAPLLVSNQGRYIWCDGPFKATIKDGKITVEPIRGHVECVTAGSTLKDAFTRASKDHFPPSGNIPPVEFLSVPQYNTWIELVYNQNQADILNYAKSVISNGFPAGVIMIDDNWQKHYGNFEFKPERFPDPKAMVDKLHSMGFKVMLWVCPFVSPDSPEYRDLAENGYLILDKQAHRPAVLHWWNGFSACYDLSNPEAYNHLRITLRSMQETYGIDGFKFDAGDPERYLEENVTVFDGKSYDTEQTELWARFGREFSYNEFRVCWKMGGQPLVQRLGDKSYSWTAVSTLVPDMIAAGMLGHIYTCPDMIGGGEYGSFRNVDEDSFDQDLIVRSCQIHSMMPMMQFSVAPWRILDCEHLDICRQYAKLHQDLGAYIIEQAKKCSVTGEPIVRAMDYSFPGEGFEDCTDQYMLGDDFLVAPLMDKSTGRNVKLPKGEWVDETSKRFKGGRTYYIEVPIDRLPYFTKVSQ